MAVSKNKQKRAKMIRSQKAKARKARVRARVAALKKSK